MLDVIVVGGGPGGLYSAIRLAGSGAHVGLAEEHPMAGQPVHCTGVMTPDAFREFNLPQDAVLNELHTVRFFSPSGRQFHYTPPMTEAVVIDRPRFDGGLYRMAKDAGVEMYMGRKVTKIEIKASQVHIECDGDANPILARACILATGASYSLHRQLSLDFPPLYLNSAQIEVPVGRTGDVEVHFGSQVAPQGFAWVVPVNRGSAHFARLGVMCSANVDAVFRRFVRGVSGLWDFQVTENVTPRKRMLPLAPISRTYGNRLLVVGDAAGLVKPTTGGGIYFSIVTAGIAAELMSEALLRDNLSKARLSKYEKRWRQKLGLEVRVQILLRLVSERLNDSEIDQLFDLARTDGANGLMSLIRNTARFNQHHDLIRTLFQHPEAGKILLRKVMASTSPIYREALDAEGSFV